MNYNYSPIILSYLSHNLFHRSDKHLTFLRRSDADTVVPVRRADQDLSLCQFIFYPHRIHFSRSSAVASSGIPKKIKFAAGGTTSNPSCFNSSAT